MTMPPVEPQVTYSVKEILDRIESKMDGFVQGLAAKADANALVLLSQQVDQHATDIAGLKSRLDAAEQEARAKSDWRRWLIPVVLSIVSTAAFVLTFFIHVA